MTWHGNNITITLFCSPHYPLPYTQTSAATINVQERVNCTLRATWLIAEVRKREKKVTWKLVHYWQIKKKKTHRNTTLKMKAIHICMVATFKTSCIITDRDKESLPTFIFYFFAGASRLKSKPINVMMAPNSFHVSSSSEERTEVGSWWYALQIKNKQKNPKLE